MIFLREAHLDGSTRKADEQRQIFGAKVVEPCAVVRSRHRLELSQPWRAAGNALRMA
jgi:hypothetical protein